MKSIMQTDKTYCYLCRKPLSEPLDEHHVFFGPLKTASERYGLKVYLHHFSCHIFGKRSVHVNAQVCRALQKKAQLIAMAHYSWSVEDFRAVYKRNFL